jgi:O-antigen/teichoic acid export membrane protein
MFFQQAITWASTFLLMLFLPRYLGPVEYGKLFLALSIVEMFKIFVAYGGNYLVAKYVSRDREKTGQILIDAVAFRLALAVFAIGILVVFINVVGYSGDQQSIILISGGVLLWHGGITAFYASYQGHEALQYTSAGAVAERVLISAGAIGALLLGAETWVIALIIVMGTLANLLVLVGFVGKIVPSIPRVDWREALGQMKAGVPYFLFAVFSVIYYRVDSVMLSKLAHGEVVGWYGGAFRLFDVLNFFPYILTVALFPVLSRLWKDADQMHRQTTLKSLEIVILAGIPIAVGVIVLAENAVGLFYGLEAYGPSVIVLQVLTAGLLFLYVDMVLVTNLLASDRQRQFTFVSLGAIPLKFGLNVGLINLFESSVGNGGIGAAVATVSTEFCIMIAAIFLTPKGTLSGFRVSLVLKGVLAGAVMGLVLLILPDTFSWVLKAALGLLVYAAVLWQTRPMEPEVETLLREIVLLRLIDPTKRLLGIGSDHIK